MLLSCVRTPSSTLDGVLEAGTFAVNFLDSGSRGVSDLFASRSEDKFAQVRWQPGPLTGMPVLGCTLAHAECSVHQVVDAGDHVIVLGRMLGGKVESNRFPLGYWRGGYVRLHSDPAA
jgi:flavin reductase (DIM6/NTAB) family NADH-FMN oxidoreductase RutF